MHLHLRLLSFLKPYRRTLALAFACSLLYALFNAVAIWFSASFITTIFNPDAAQNPGAMTGPAGDLNETLKTWAWQFIDGQDRFELVTRVGIIFFVAFLLRNFFDVAQMYFISFVEQRVIKDLRDRLYSRLLAQRLGFFYQRKAGDLASVALNDISALNNQVAKILTFIMRDPFVILIFLALLITISWRLTLTALVLLPLAGVLMDQLGKSLKRKSARVQEALSQVTHLLHERLSGIRLIKIAGTEEDENERFQEATHRHFRMALRQRRLDILNVPLTEIMGLGIISLILIYGGWLVLRAQTVDGEDFVRFIALLFSILAPVKSLGAAWNALQIASASGERIFRLMDLHEELPVPAHPVRLTGLVGSLKLEGVSFRYDGTEIEALTDVDLEIRYGETVAVVGPSGSGKTTLVGLVLRLFDPTRGRVTLSGADLREIDPRDLRRLFGVVPQDTVLFNDTVAANIGYGGDGLSREAIERAARLAYAEDFILAQPQGYDTPVGDRGLRLSGGQQQRLSIARALVQNPPIIIFDEATSQLDSESEGLIQQAFEALRREHTMIVIAHRLATVRRADRIVVLEKGRVIDQGRYEDLLTRCELFNRLCQQQFLTAS
ncbi:MAG: ABC transporter ATP-binding protein [Candidatus Zixiibacteriota bacterium]|nr:MAG: ABC transporter ATP-binding protein [candidate division Zixibacteria bacterium]